MEQRELIERLVPLIPPPRAHQVRYLGILAPAAGLRDRIVPCSTPPELEANERGVAKETGASPQPGEVGGEDGDPRDDVRARAARIRWARLLMRVFEVDALRCPECGAGLRLLAAIEDPEVACKILACLDLPVRAPPILPAQAAGVRVEGDRTDDDFDQTPAFADPW